MKAVSACSIATVALVLVLLVHIMATASEPVPDPSATDIDVIVLVRDPHGNSLPDVPVEAYSTIGAAVAFTNESGVAKMQVRTLNADGHIWVGLTSGDVVLFDQQQNALATAQYDELVETYAFRSWISEPVVADQQSAIVTFDALPRIAISGILESAPEQLYEGAVFAIGHIAYSDLPGTQPGGGFELSSVARSEPSVLVISGVGPQGHIVDIGSDLTAADLDLGTVILAEAVCDSTLELRFTNNEGMLDLPDPAAIGYELCLIRSDASVLLTLQLDRRYGTANVFSAELDDAPGVDVPAGVYYVSPGKLGRRTALLLVRSVQQGLIQELENAGVPKVELIAGERTVVTIDARAAYDAVHEAAAALGP